MLQERLPLQWGKSEGTLFELWREPYKFSNLIRRTHETNHQSVVDLDGTYAAGSLRARMLVRKLLEQRGALIFSTARTAELVMSNAAFEISRYAGGFDRSQPKWRLNPETKLYEFVDLAELDELKCLIDPPDAIYAFGDNIYLRQQAWCTEMDAGPYVADFEYERQYLDPLYHNGTEKLRWWYRAMAVVEAVNASMHLSLIDDPEAFGEGRVNTKRPKRRIQIDLYGSKAIEQKNTILADLAKKLEGTPLAGHVEGVDESRPNDNDPDKHKVTLYVMHPSARKEDMINRGLLETCRYTRQETRQITIDIFGDTLTDFASMFDAGYDATVTGVVVGGRLADTIMQKNNFAGVDLSRYYAMLTPTERPGVFLCHNPNLHGGKQLGGPKREIIVGSVAYENTDGADTMLAYLEERQRQLAA